MAQTPFSGFQQRDQNEPLLKAIWTPVTPAHAVLKATIIIQLSENITSISIKRAVDAVRAIAMRSGLHKEDQLNTVTFELTPGAAPKSASSENGGTSFSDIRGNIVAQSLTISNDAIRFETRLYTRWVALTTQFAQYLEVLLPIISNSSSVRSVAVEYLDMFVAVNEGAQDASLVLDRKSDFIVRGAFKKSEPFHSHAGWFEIGEPGTNRLVNIDINVHDSLGPPGLRRTVQVRTHEAENIADQLGERAQAFSNSEVLMSALDELHNHLKKRLALVLTREARSLISLGV